jgi:hypothetical protein
MPHYKPASRISHYYPHSHSAFQPLYSTVTLFARFLGWSTCAPRATAM